MSLGMLDIRFLSINIRASKIFLETLLKKY